MSKLKYIPPHQLSQQHVGKPMKLRLKNGKEIYGTIKEIRKDGIVFIPVNYSSIKKSSDVHSSLFPIFPPIFIPFGFFIPFIIF